MIIDYERSEAAWSFEEVARDLITTSGSRTVCELGAGANPAVPRDLVDERGLELVLVDVSEEELAKAPDGYRKVVADASAEGFELPGSFDLVLSRTVAEHVENAETFHTNVHRMLEDGGRALHFFPTLYALPFVVNRLLPEWAGGRLLSLIQSGREQEGRHGKFPAHYRWCRGPTRHQIRRFERIGFEVERYVGYFGHHYYDRIPPLQRLVDGSADLLVRHPFPLFTSYAQVVLRKKAAA
jgi:SAM-dependent methyltransferase